jgi:hypothetical protein
MNTIREQNRLIESLKKQLRDAEDSYQIYVPDVRDPIDTRLADYINAYEDRSRLRIMFMKESEGVYQFGSRRVYVRVERDKITGKQPYISGFITVDSESRRWIPEH